MSMRRPEATLNLAQHRGGDRGFVRGRIQRGQPLLQLAQVQLANLRKAFAGDPHQTTRFPQTGASALGAIVVHHDLLQIRPTMPSMLRPCLRVPMVMPLDLAHDSLEGHLLARVLLTLARAFRQDNFDLFAFAAIEDHVLDLFCKALERDVKAEAIVSSQTAQPASPPGVFVMVKGFLHDRAVPKARLGSGTSRVG